MSKGHSKRTTHPKRHPSSLLLRRTGLDPDTAMPNMAVNTESKMPVRYVAALQQLDAIRLSF